MSESKFHRNQERIAIIGSGIAGLATSYILTKNGHRVTIYEKNDYCGGHTLTDKTASPPVDLGFMVFNLKNYPHLTAFFDQLEVESEESDMSFSVSIDQGSLEWASHSLNTVFSQWKNVASPKFWRMIYDVIRFSRAAPRLLDPKSEAASQEANVSVKEYLQKNGYSRVFLLWYLLPMSAAIWSAPNSAVMQFPIKTLVQFFSNHCMLNPFGERPCWRVLKKRGQSYVGAVLQHLNKSKLGHARTSCSVSKVKVLAEKDGKRRVRVTEKDGSEQTFDKVVFACHPDQALAILGDEATDKERSILGAIKYQNNEIYLHSDPRLMPRGRSNWASWNVMHDSELTNEDSEASVFVSYWLNHLQNLGDKCGHRFCTLNASFPPEKDKIIRKLHLAHPLLTGPAVEAQSKIPTLQGERSLYFCGAWCKYGFHEDGIWSAVQACQSMPGVKIPWTPRSLTPESTMLQSYCLRTFDLLARTCITRGSLLLILPNGRERFYGQTREALRSSSYGSNNDEKSSRPSSAPNVTLYIKNMDFFVKVVKSADIGLGEAWMSHDFETQGSKPRDRHRFGARKDPNMEPLIIRKSDQLTDLIELAILNNQGEKMWKSMRGSSLLTVAGSIGSWIYHKTRSNTLKGSKKNIAESYDVSNELFNVLLAPSWMYSSAFYKTGKESIEEAQLAKLDMIIEKAKIKEGDHVLEIGCGWGEFAIRAATTKGCRVTGVTISQEQLKLAQARVKEAGVAHLVTIVEKDYRKLQPPQNGFDAIVSIEMLEAVGKEYLGVYHESLHRLLKEGGRAVIQVITTPEWRYQSYKNRLGSDFIARYIFPGSHLPSVQACVQACKSTDLVLEHEEDIGLSYSPTLRDWRIRLIENQEKIKKMRQTTGSKKLFDDTFIRMYEFYFSYCEAAFQTQYIGDHQLVWRKDSSKNKKPKSEKKASLHLAKRSFHSISLMVAAAGFLHLGFKALRRNTIASTS